jgi:hypothetical protein
MQANGAAFDALIPVSKFVWPSQSCVLQPESRETIAFNVCVHPCYQPVADRVAEIKPAISRNLRMNAGIETATGFIGDNFFFGTELLPADGRLFIRVAR